MNSTVTWNQIWLMKAKCARSADSKRLIVYFRQAYCFQRKLRSSLEKLNSRCWSGISTGTKLANITTFFILHLSVLSRKAPVLPLNQSLSLAHAQFAHTVLTITLLHLLLFLCVCVCVCLHVWGWTLVKVHVWGSGVRMGPCGVWLTLAVIHPERVITRQQRLPYSTFSFSSPLWSVSIRWALKRWNNVMQYNNEYDHCQQLGPPHPSVSRLPPKEHDKRLLELVLSFCPKHIQQLLSLPCHCLVFCVFFLHYLSLFVAVLCSVTPCSRLPGGKVDEAGKLWWESGPALSALHWRAP